MEIKYCINKEKVENGWEVSVRLTGAQGITVIQLHFQWENIVDPGEKDEKVQFAWSSELERQANVHLQNFLNNGVILSIYQMSVGDWIMDITDDLPICRFLLPEDPGDIKLFELNSAIHTVNLFPHSTERHILKNECSATIKIDNPLEAFVYYDPNSGLTIFEFSDSVNLDIFDDEGRIVSAEITQAKVISFNPGTYFWRVNGEDLIHKIVIHELP